MYGGQLPGRETRLFFWSCTDSPSLEGTIWSFLFLCFLPEQKSPQVVHGRSLLFEVTHLTKNVLRKFRKHCFLGCPSALSRACTGGVIYSFLATKGISWARSPGYLCITCDDHIAWIYVVYTHILASDLVRIRERQYGSDMRSTSTALP